MIKLEIIGILLTFCFLAHLITAMPSEEITAKRDGHVLSRFERSTNSTPFKSSRSKCTIKNKHYNEYLYAASGWHSYTVYTWVPGNIDDEAFYWEINVPNDGVVEIFNSYYGRHLYRGELYDSDTMKYEAYVALDPDNYEKTWKLYLDEKRNYFINNAASNQHYLFADVTKLNSSRRRVFLKRYSSLTNFEKECSKWEITCY